MSKSAAGRVCLFLSLLLLLAGTAACREASEFAAGNYVGIYGKWVCDDDSERITDEIVSLDLNADGTGVFHRDDYDFSVTWKQDGAVITIRERFLGASNEYTGTLVDGTLEIFSGDPEDPLAYEYVLEKE